jgi:hypothetical protein
MKIKIRTLEGVIFEVEESIIEAYKVPKEEVDQQLKQLKNSLRLDISEVFKEEQSKLKSQKK